jgi:hypothetical protein
MPNGFPPGANCIGRATSIALVAHFCLFAVALRDGVLFNG